MKSSTGRQSKVVFLSRLAVLVLLTLGRGALNDRMILLLLDAERQTVGGTDVSLEKTPYAVRAIGK
jgi:hypothetical protein